MGLAKYLPSSVWSRPILVEINITIKHTQTRPGLYVFLSGCASVRHMSCTERFTFLKSDVRSGPSQRGRKYSATLCPSSRAAPPWSDQVWLERHRHSQSCASMSRAIRVAGPSRLIDFRTPVCNDPIGNLSKNGLDAKKSGKLTVLKIPKHLPDLNVLDYAHWSEVKQRMRLQECKWPSSEC